MSNLYLCVYALAVTIFCFAFVYLFLLFLKHLFSYSAQRKFEIINKKNSNLAMNILENGGPKTLDEFLILYPGACPACGSTDIIRLEWEAVSVIPEIYFYSTYEGSADKCGKCNKLVNGINPDNFPRILKNKKSIKVTSPYNDILDQQYSSPPNAK